MIQLRTRPVVHTHHPGTWEVEAEGSEVQGYPLLHGESEATPGIHETLFPSQELGIEWWAGQMKVLMYRTSLWQGRARLMDGGVCEVTRESSRKASVGR